VSLPGCESETRRFLPDQHQLTAHPRLIIILNLEIQNWNGEKIGNPTNLEQQQAANPIAPVAPAANGRGAPAAARGAAAKGGASRTAGKDMGPLYPIEGLSPYQNK
jgi:replication factor A1